MHHNKEVLVTLIIDRRVFAVPSPNPFPFLLDMLYDIVKANHFQGLVVPAKSVVSLNSHFWSKSDRLK